MPKIIIIEGHNKGTVHSFFGEVTLGRSDECDLVLDHGSVSRKHVRLSIDGDQFFVEDLDSHNGVRVGGEKVSTLVVDAGTEVQVGRYTIVPMDDRTRTYMGQTIAYLANHMSVDDMEPARTLEVSTAQLDGINRNRERINQACVISATDETQRWNPGAHKLTFGGKGMIEVSGWFSGGIVAELVWDGQHHLLRRLSRWAGITINGQKVTEGALNGGDAFTVGGSEFVFEAPE